MPELTIRRGRFWFSVAITLCLGACGGGGSSGGNPPGGGGPGDTWLIPVNEIVDGGPGRDGIPSIDNPAFEPIANNIDVGDDDLVIAIQAGADIKVYPHDIMDWHEVVNDVGATANDPFMLSYCPLTGSAIAWDVDETLADSTFGVSGRLFNSNLILFDRETSSFWVQMMELAVNGERINDVPDRLQVIETTKSTIRTMYPNAMILTRNTGFTRDYDDYPYGSYRQDPDLLFPVANSDSRLHPKTRVLGVRLGNQVKAYQLDGFGDTTLAVQDQVGGRSIVVVGNTAENYAVAYDRELADGTILNLTAFSGADPVNVLQDDEGNVWNIWGTAVSGPRSGQQLQAITAYTAYWFALAAFYTEVAVYFNPT